MVDTENDSTKSGTRRRKRDVRWTVVASVQPQCSERLRWVQLVWAPEPVSDWWPKRRDRGAASLGEGSTGQTPR